MYSNVNLFIDGAWKPAISGKTLSVLNPATAEPIGTVAHAEKDFSLLRHTGTHAFAWIASDLNAHGVVGDASIATAEKGRLTAEFQADGFIRLLQDVRALRLGDYLA